MALASGKFPAKSAISSASETTHESQMSGDDGHRNVGARAET